MTPEQWARRKDWFGQAIDDPTCAPDVVLAAEREDPQLATELRALLKEHARSAFDTDAMRNTASAADGAAPDTPDLVVSPRDVGPYAIVRELGRGGAGVVYLAERRDDEFHRQVALKLLRHSAWDRPELEWLTRERRALAHLQHPNIAALVDWGVTDDGTPWLATEFIDGEPIDRYCASHALDVPKTLALFEQVCQAVQYAHRRLIVHRDLKPANVFVTNAGLVKLLDFGISKPLDDAASTQSTERRLTPAYASPEQIDGSDITLATDVYGLGLLLYELLTGTVPNASGSLLDLARRLDDEPAARPSTADGLSAERQRAIRGDLDRIVGHALARNPEQRYPSVEQMLADLQRHRDGFPITVTAPTVVDRAMKFVRRHRVAMLFAATAVLALVIGAGVALWNARVARREEAIARARFDDVRSQAHWVIFDAHDMIRLVPGSIAVRQALLSKATEYLDGLQADHVQDDQLLKEIAQAYLRVAYFQGGLTGTNVGNTARAVRTYRSALALLDPLWRRHPEDEWVGACRFAAVYNLSMMLPDPADAEALLRSYIPDVEAWIGRATGSPPLQAGELVHAAMARALRAQGKADAALAEVQLSLDRSARAMPFTHTDNTPRPMFGTWLDMSQAHFDTGLALFVRAEALLDLGRAADAVAAAEEAQTRFDKARHVGTVGPSDERMFARVRGLHARALVESGQVTKLPEALALAAEEMRVAVANTKDGMATAWRDLAEAHRHSAMVRVALHDVAGAERQLQGAIELMDALASSDPDFVVNRVLWAGMLNDLANVRLTRRDAPGAIAAFTRARDIAATVLASAPHSHDGQREYERASAGLARINPS